MTLRLKNILPVLFIALVIFSMFAPSAIAQTPATANTSPSGTTVPGKCSWYDPFSIGCVNEALAGIVNGALTVTGLLLTFAAGLLNVSIIVTLHIKDFVANTPAIYSIWQTIRDITGIFFIFFLLYAAFEIILGFGNSYGKLVSTIVVAGILINFSFFIVSVLIDASNVVSLAIYNAMVPTSITYNAGTTIASLETATTALTPNSSPATSAAAGISSIFMNSLKIQNIYDTSNNNVRTAITDPLTIFLIGVVGVIIEITASLSFLLAALAFIARLIILLFLLAFSPIWFAGMVIPQLKDHVGKFKTYLTDQLIFMPVYLLLMYAALNVLNTSNIMGAANSTTNGLPTGTNWAFSYMILFINFAMVIVMLNLPLVVGLAMGGEATKFLGKYTSKFNAANIWKKVGSEAKMGSYGRLASMASRNEHLQDFASKWKVGELALKGVRNVASDYNKKTEAQISAKTQFADSLGYNQRDMNAAQLALRTAQSNLASARATGILPPGQTMQDLERAVGQAKGGIGNVESKRKEAYARKTESRTAGLLGSTDTLLLKISRRDKLAAAKMHIPVLEKQLTARKDSLKETRDDLKQLTNAIRNNQAGPGMNNIAGLGFATAQQQTDLNNLRNDEVNKLATVNGLEAQLDQYKLIK